MARRRRKSLAAIRKAEDANLKTFLYDVVLRPISPEAALRFGRQVEAMIGRPLTQADVDSLLAAGKPPRRD